MKKILSFLFFIVLSFSLIGCSLGKSYSITVSEEDSRFSLEVGATKQVAVTFEGDGVVWKSNNESVASVNDGLVTALSEGSAIITVSVKGHDDVNATINVTVIKKNVAVSGIAIAGKKTEVDEGAEFNLTAVVTPTDATDKTVTWASSDSSVATVTDGKVKALKAGTTEISATAGDKTDKFTLKVVVHSNLATFIAIDPGKQVFHIGETDLAFAEVDPDADDTAIVWSTSDSSVITIDQTGLVTAVGAGKADVIATTHDGSNLSDSYKVVVYADVTEMTITGEASMPLNGTQKLNVTVNSDSASDLVWSSSDPTIASVVENTGFVTALK